MSPHTFRKIDEVRVGDFIAELEVIESGVIGADDKPLPARGHVSLWPVNERGERNRRYSNPLVSFQLDADGWAQFAALAARASDVVRQTP